MNAVLKNDKKIYFQTIKMNCVETVFVFNSFIKQPLGVQKKHQTDHQKLLILQHYCTKFFHNVLASMLAIAMRKNFHSFFAQL